MEEKPIKVYARCNSMGQVNQFLDTVHFKDEIRDTDIFVSEGYGDDYAYSYARATEPLIPYDMDMCHNWVLDGSIIRKATQAEKAAETEVKAKPEPTFQEDLMALTVDIEYRLTLLELGV